MPLVLFIILYLVSDGLRWIVGQSSILASLLSVEVCAAWTLTFTLHIYLILSEPSPVCFALDFSVISESADLRDGELGTDL